MVLVKYYLNTNFIINKAKSIIAKVIPVIFLVFLLKNVFIILYFFMSLNVFRNEWQQLRL
jgi:hypothetical protein